MNQPSLAPQNLRRVSDLHLSAFLVAKGHPLVNFVSGPRAAFIFADVPERDLVAYFGGDDQVSARALLDALKNLKGLLQGVRR
jgi:hypothetical protein